MRRVSICGVPLTVVVGRVDDYWRAECLELKLEANGDTQGSAVANLFDEVLPALDRMGVDITRPSGLASANVEGCRLAA